MLQLGGDPSIYFDYILIFHGPVSRILRHVYVAQLSLVSLWYNEFSAETTTLTLGKFHFMTTSEKKKKYFLDIWMLDILDL